MSPAQHRWEESEFRPAQLPPRVGLGNTGHLHLPSVSGTDRERTGGGWKSDGQDQGGWGGCSPGAVVPPAPLLQEESPGPRTTCPEGRSAQLLRYRWAGSWRYS